MKCLRVFALSHFQSKATAYSGFDGAFNLTRYSLFFCINSAVHSAMPCEIRKSTSRSFAPDGQFDMIAATSHVVRSRLLSAHKDLTGRCEEAAEQLQAAYALLCQRMRRSLQACG
jgi:hypothetical protein